MAKFKNVDTALAPSNGSDQQSEYINSFEYIIRGLKIRSEFKSDRYEIMMFLNKNGVEFYTLNHNPEQLHRIPFSKDSNEVVARLREKDLIVSNVRQIKRNAIIYSDHTVTLLLYG